MLILCHKIINFIDILFDMKGMDFIHIQIIKLSLISHVLEDCLYYNNYKQAIIEKHFN